MTTELTRGWHTDLAISRFAGAEVTDHGDHYVIRSPHSPTFHWGNFVLVTDPDAVDAADRWLSVFAANFPEARHVAIGLPGLPSDSGSQAWAASGLAIDTDEVLFTTTQPSHTPIAPGYVSRSLEPDDWEGLVRLDAVQNERTGEHESAGYEQFVRNQNLARRGLIERGRAQWFGAADADTGELVATLGVVACDGVARYQSVGTDADHRRRGLAAHLLGMAAQWAADHGCDQWVIVTETTNPAGRVYRSVGFEPDAVQVAAYRA